MMEKPGKTYGTKNLGEYQMVGGYQGAKMGGERGAHHDKQDEVGNQHHAMAYQPCPVPSFDCVNSPEDNKIKAGR